MLDQEDYTLRLYKEGDEEKIVTLLLTAIDDWRLRGDRALDFWRWMYKDNPDNLNMIQVGVSGEDIIATFHGFSLRAKVGEDIVNCNYATDLVVHPDFRRRGISNKIREIKKRIMLEQGIRFNYSHTVNPIIIRIHRERHKTFPLSLIRYLRIKDVSLHLSKKNTRHPWLAGTVYRIVRLSNFLKSALTGSMPPIKKFNVNEIDRFDPRIEDFWRRVSEHYKLIAVRDREYLNWRFCDPHAGDYTILLAEDGDMVLGYAVLGIEKKTPGYPEGYILDLLALPDRPDVADALVSEAARRFDLKGINSIICQIIKNHPYEEILKINGFADSRTKTNIFYYEIGDFDLIDAMGSVSPKSVHWSYSDLYLL